MAVDNNLNLPAKPPSWRALAGACLVAVAVYVALSLALQWGDKHLSSALVYRLLIQGEALLVDNTGLEVLQQELYQFATAEQAALLETMQTASQQQLDAVFSLAEQGVTNYLDWYYSVPGSYWRLFFALQGKLTTKLNEQLEQQIFVVSGVNAQLEELATNFATQIVAATELEQEQRWRSLQPKLYTQLSQVSLNLSQLQQTELNSSNLITLDLDAAVHPDFNPQSLDQLRWQLSAGSAAGVGLGALTLPSARLLVQRFGQTAAARSATRVTTSYAARLAPRLGLAAAASGSASLAAAPSGPGAVLVGLATLGAFMASDWALLKVEEAKYRPAQAQALAQDLAQARQDLDVSLQQQLASLLLLQQQQLQQRLQQPYQQAGLAPLEFKILAP